MELFRAFRQNGGQDFNQWQKGMSQEFEETIDTIIHLTYKRLALHGTTLTGLVFGGTFGIAIVGGAKAAAGGSVIGGCVLFGACQVGTKWSGYSLNTKRFIKTVGVVSAASANGGVVCFALGAAISGPVLLRSVVGLALTGGAAVIGYLADARDKENEEQKLKKSINQLEKEKEEQKKRINQLEKKNEDQKNEIAKLKKENEEQKKDKEEQKKRIDQLEKENEEQKNEIANLKKDNDEQKQRMDQLEKENEDQKNDIAELKKDNDEQKQKTDELEDRLARLERLMLKNSGGS